RDEQPAPSVGLHDERVVAGDRVLRLGAVGRDVVRRLRLLEVGSVETGPLALLGIPPDELLALGPRLPVGIGGRAIVEEAAVRRPRPRPFGRDVALLPVWLAPRGLVDPVGVGAAVDPAAADRRSDLLPLLVGGEELARRNLPAADLREHRLGVRLLD